MSAQHTPDALAGVIPPRPARFAGTPRDSRQSTVVLKFGSSVLDPRDGLADCVQEVYREVRSGRRVVAVVSAFPGVTDSLLASAERAFERGEPAAGGPDPALLASYVATGEPASAAFLGIALDKAGIPARVVGPKEVGLIARGPHLDAEPAALDVPAVEALFEQASVLVLPGFYGQGPDGAVALFGRGGSDLTALFVAERLGAECRLLKDVAALHPHDPSVEGPSSVVYRTASWEDALRVGGKLVQPKALRFARDHGVEFSVAAPLGEFRTEIGGGHSVLVPHPRAPEPVRVILLGLGTVGQGVYRRIAARPDRYRVVGVAVRDLAKQRDVRVPEGLLVDDARELLDRPADQEAGSASVVVELIGGRETALSLIRASLEQGRHVVTANKDVISHHGAELDALARANGVRLEYSASVGGAVPVLEAAGGPWRRIEGVVNGTCNFVLDRLAEGDSFEAAVARAKELGFAEEDPRLDLSGADSAHKLAVLARSAFGADLVPEEIPCVGIEALPAPSAGRVWKLVASCSRTPDGVCAEVRPVQLLADHPLAGARNEENRVVFYADKGDPLLLRGKGAGRWPTSVSVVADLEDVVACAARRTSGRLALAEV